VTLSACREYLRRSARHHDVDTEPSPGPDLGDLESALDVRRAVTALGEPCRGTLELHFFEDLTQAEVAKRLGSPPGTIAARVSRCLNRLRDALQEHPAARASREVR
jgi:RNA polymerase sigma factor (sigma-70 family)